MEIVDKLDEYYSRFFKFVEQASGIWVLYQLAAIGLALAVSYFFTRAISRRIENYLDGYQGRWLQIWRGNILERIAPVIFLALVWLELAIFRQITWFSNTLLLGIAAKLSTAWIVINILASVIRNQFFFRVVSIALWIMAALSILQLLPAVIAYTDSIAFNIGSNRISLFEGVKAVTLFAILIWAVGLMSRIAERGLERTKDISPSMKVLLSKIVRLALFVVAIVMAMNAVGIDLTAFAVFSGAVGVGLGFGLQKTVSNFISGISLLLDKSIKPGDVISVGETFGWITQLNTRYTSVVTRDGREHLIPNENLITQEVINWSYSNKNVRLEVPFGVSYKSDPHQIKQLLEENIEFHRRVLPNPKPVVHFIRMGDSSLDFVVRFWIRDPAEGVVNIKSEILFAVWDVLKSNNIEIPFPQRDLNFPKGVVVSVAKEE